MDLLGQYGFPPRTSIRHSPLLKGVIEQLEVVVAWIKLLLHVCEAPVQELPGVFDGWSQCLAAQCLDKMGQQHLLQSLSSSLFTDPAIQCGAGQRN
jgi:hypothetical protein